MANYELTVTTPPIEEPITTGEVILKLRTSIDEADPIYEEFIADLGRLIAAARGFAEDYTFKKLLTQSVRMVIQGFPGVVQGVPSQSGEIHLPVSPVSAVTAVKYRDVDGIEQTLTVETDYLAWTGHFPPLVYPAPGTSWPATKSGRKDAVTVEFTAGHPHRLAVPAGFRQAILEIVVFSHENPGDDPRGGMVSIPPHAERLLNQLSNHSYL